MMKQGVMADLAVRNLIHAQIACLQVLDTRVEMPSPR